MVMSLGGGTMQCLAWKHSCCLYQVDQVVKLLNEAVQCPACACIPSVQAVHGPALTTACCPGVALLRTSHTCPAGVHLQLWADRCRQDTHHAGRQGRCRAGHHTPRSAPGKGLTGRLLLWLRGLSLGRFDQKQPPPCFSILSLRTCSLLHLSHHFMSPSNVREGLL